MTSHHHHPDDDDLVDSPHPSVRREELADRHRRVEQQWLEHRRRMELIEAQKRELEELAQRQQEVLTGRKEMGEKLRRALVVLEREEETAKREVEQIVLTKAAFEESLDSIERISPESWDSDHIAEALVESVSRIDHARAVFSQHTAKVQVLRGNSRQERPDEPARAESAHWSPSSGGPLDDAFGAWLARGLAFNLPLLLLIAIYWGLVHLRL